MDRQKKGPGIRRSMSFSHVGLYGQSYHYQPKIQLLPPPEVTRIRCMATKGRQLPEPKVVKRSQSFLRKLRGKDSGKPVEPMRKLPLPEIFYNNNEFEIIENLSDKEEDDSENQEEHESPSEDESWHGEQTRRPYLGPEETQARRPYLGPEETQARRPYLGPEESQARRSYLGPEETKARRPYLGPEESHPPPIAAPTVAPQKPPQYQPVNKNYTPGVGMVSRRAIISRSRDDLQHHLGVNNKNFTGEDQWFSKEKLYKDHIAEVLEKWDNIDDEIWAKVIVLERNRRIAKAYARAPVLTVSGSEDGFDGFRIGVNGFENPMRDHKVTEFKSQIGAGCKLKMDDSGNILIKRVSKSNIYVKNTAEETAVSNDILKLPNGLLEMDKPFKLFDMKKFQQNVNREMKRQFPERNKLETQCISTIAFVKNEAEVLDSPIWIMLINIVALEMLGAKMPKPTGPKTPATTGQFTTGTLKKNVHSGSSDEDPYSLTPSGSSGSSGKGLRDRSREESGSGTRTRDSDGYGPQNWTNTNKGIPNDLSDDYVEDDVTTRDKAMGRNRARLLKKAEEKRRNDDPYYCGFSARVPTFNYKKVTRERAASRDVVGRQRMLSPGRGVGNVSQLPGPSVNPFWWQSRLYPDSGIGELSSGASAGSPAMSNFRGNNSVMGSQLRNGGMAFRTQELSSFHEGGKKHRDYRSYFATNPRPSLFSQGWE